MAVVKSIIEEIEKDVIDVINTDFVYYVTGVVPQRNDAQLTFESGIQKKGKVIRTCVLYVDIRNSVGLTEKHHNITMGKIYTAFTKAVLKVARHHNGHVRNIIGDRVMVVFPVKDCFTNAVDCAISINHIAQYIIGKQFKKVDFKCGIGIDYGDLRIIKVGIQRNGNENPENKGLVWAGYPANIASRLTDSAKKTVKEIYYEVVWNPVNYASIFGELNYFPMSEPIVKKQPLYSKRVETVEMTPEQFAEKISITTSGDLFMSGGNLISFSKKTRTISYPNILMTEEVYKGFRSANPNRPSIKANLWTEQKHNIKNVSGKVYGGFVTWDI